MEFLGLSPIEMIVIVVVAVLVFGQRLPQVAGEAAATLQKVKRSLSDLRRETGIDQEIYRAKREFEESVRKPVKTLDVQNTIRREAEATKKEIAGALDTSTAPTTPSEAPKPPAPESSAAPGPG